MLTYDTDGLPVPVIISIVVLHVNLYGLVNRIFYT